MCCAWVKAGPDQRAIGVDLDSEPLTYGTKNYLSQLRPEAQKRVQILQMNVMNPKLPPADIVCALNFSYFILKTRDELKHYFQSVYKTLNRRGLFVVTPSAGQNAGKPTRKYAHPEDGYTYYWEQGYFDPISHESKFHIHFKRPGEVKRQRVFTYDWRVWSIAEIRDLMAEVGFKETHVYWEGTDKNGDGNGIFRRSNKGEECEALSPPI